jgi:anthranilate/para-aminobenzoate synthase component I
LSSADRAPLSFVELRAALEFDHAAHRVTLMACSDHDAVALSTALTDTNARPQHDAETPATYTTTWRHPDASYAHMVEHCREAIRRGDAYQLCLTNQISAPGTWDALAVYSRLREDNPSHHGAMLSIGGVHLLSSSPEVFLRLSAEGRLSTMPIKGTRPRGMDAEADTQLIRELLESEKEQAENLMIVDLMRNDLSRVGELGTVAAENLLQVHSLPHVHQLVSTVSTQLRAGLSAVDAIEATFPAGSMTGAPKIAAMSILNELEVGPRGIYSGAFGWLGYDGASELAMVIRSIVIDDDGASIGTGGGITIDSNPQAEVDEMKLKAEPALRALGLV